MKYFVHRHIGIRYSMRVFDNGKVVGTLKHAKTAQEIVDYICANLPPGTSVQWCIP